MSFSRDPEVWIAAALGAGMLSSAWRDNPVSRFAEHLFAGCAAGGLAALEYHAAVKAGGPGPLLEAAGRDPRAPRVVLLVLMCLAGGGWGRVWPGTPLRPPGPARRTLGAALAIALAAALVPAWLGWLAALVGRLRLVLRALGLLPG